MITPGKDRIKKYRAQQKKKIGGKTLSVWIGDQTARDIERLKKQYGGTNQEILEKAIELCGQWETPPSASPPSVSLALEGPLLRQFRFLRDIMAPDKTILQTAVSELYHSRFNQHIHAKVEEIRRITNHIDKRVAMKQLMTLLYGDQGNLKSLKNSLNYLEVPPHGKFWGMEELRNMLKELSIDVG